MAAILSRADSERQLNIARFLILEHEAGGHGDRYCTSIITGRGINLAVFNHAIVKLKVACVAKLIAAPGLAAVLNDLKISIIRRDPWC